MLGLIVRIAYRIFKNFVFQFTNAEYFFEISVLYISNKIVLASRIVVYSKFTYTIITEY